VTTLPPYVDGPAAQPAIEPPRREAMVTRADVVLAVLTVVVLVVVGVLLGLLWAKISPHRPRGYVVQGGIIADETEAFIAGDGRFAIITALAGLVAAVALWTRPAWRGPAAIGGLVVGGVLGALATDGIGRLVGGGQASAPVGQAIDALPLQVHALSLLAIEALVAVLVYGLLVVFSNRDDLGRPIGASIRSGDDPQRVGGDGDRPGLL
jgi:hypothetical protein